MKEIRKLDSGLRFVIDQIPHLESVTAGIWVRAGCVLERPNEKGISHFIEHMMFKGTNKRSAKQIAMDTDAIGAQMNAFTAKESTCYYVKSLSSNMDKAVEILADMFTDSVFSPGEMAKEKQVVVEEIKMNEDSPEDDAQDMIYEELFRDNPLERSILGTQESLEAISRDDILNYIKREYTLDNIVIALSGNFDADSVCDAFDKALSGAFAPSKETKGYEIKPSAPSFRTKVKDIEQSHICLGTRALSYEHDDVPVMSVLNNIFGGSMSSRLFQNIREDKGMAYSVYSYAGYFDQEGIFGISAGVAHNKIEATVEAVLEELEKLKREGISEHELEVSKEQIKGSLIFGLESTSSRMVANGKLALMRNKVREQEEAIQRIDSVSMDDIKRVIDIITDVSGYSGVLVSRRDVDLGTLLK